MVCRVGKTLTCSFEATFTVGSMAEARMLRRHALGGSSRSLGPSTASRTFLERADLRRVADTSAHGECVSSRLTKNKNCILHFGPSLERAKSGTASARSEPFQSVSVVRGMSWLILLLFLSSRRGRGARTRLSAKRANEIFVTIASERSLARC